MNNDRGLGCNAPGEKSGISNRLYKISHDVTFLVLKWHVLDFAIDVSICFTRKTSIDVSPFFLRMTREYEQYFDRPPCGLWWVGVCVGTAFLRADANNPQFFRRSKRGGKFSLSRELLGGGQDKGSRHQPSSLLQSPPRCASRTSLGSLCHLCDQRN